MSGGSLAARALGRRTNPLVRLGVLVLLGRGFGGPRTGLALMGAGMLLGRRRRDRKVLLHRHDVEPGETLRIRVTRGADVLGERTIEG